MEKRGVAVAAAAVAAVSPEAFPGSGKGCNWCHGGVQGIAMTLAGGGEGASRLWTKLDPTKSRAYPGRAKMDRSSPLPPRLNADIKSCCFSIFVQLPSKWCPLSP